MKKKIVAFLLAAIMIAGMGVSSFAAEINTVAGMQQNMSLSSAAQNKRFPHPKRRSSPQNSCLNFRRNNSVYWIIKK